MTKLAFATEICSRCAGTGNFSWNAMTGSRCFKCEGRKVALTKQALKARAWMKAQERQIEARDLVVGQVIDNCGGRLTVQSVVEDGIASIIEKDGTRTPFLTITGLKASVSCHPTSKFNLLPTREEKIENTRKAREMFPGAIVEVEA